MSRLIIFFLLSIYVFPVFAQKSVPEKPRVLISTDIGGTDPDDNQSLAHLLMYADLLEIEGLVSSPSYGTGSTSEIFRMIDLYEKDLPKLQKHSSEFPKPDDLRKVTKQGCKGNAPYRGVTSSTEGSDWIIRCA
ncbi:MAG TPA: nucleoside hydrolase-like domain-containing protein, partial [Algoriphagus sp.]|nr:nucleoside hydrolase-like domain-containing protein [Algoriphagus sp.]